MQVTDVSRLNQLSMHLLYGTKPERIEARTKLVEITRNFTIDFNHTTDTYWNRVRYAAYYFKATGQFVYGIEAKNPGYILKSFQAEAAATSAIAPSAEPAYVAMMPHCPKQSHDILHRQLALLNQEGFGNDSLLSEFDADQRLRVVVGINRCHSLNPAVNKAFRTYVRTFRTNYTNVKVCAFFWHPHWEKTIQGVDNLSHREIQRLFKLFYHIDRQQAEALACQLESVQKEVPYQFIRQHILKHSFTRDFCLQFRHGNSLRPLWLFCCDDDAVHYKIGNNPGLFSVYDQLQKDHPNMEAGTTGYLVEDPVNDFYLIGSTVDLEARRHIAINRPNGVIYPEPNFLIRVDLRNTLESLGRISFIRKKSPGDSLESLGILENLNLHKGNVIGRLVFANSGEIITARPSRFKIAEKVKGSIYLWHILHSCYMQSLHVFGQSSIRPLDGFAMNLARSLSGNKASRHTKTLIAAVFKVFDIVTYAEGIGVWWYHYYLPVREEILSIYAARLGGHVNPNYRLRAERIMDDLKYPNPELHSRLTAFLETQSDHYLKAIQALVNQSHSQQDIAIINQASLDASSGMYEAVNQLFFCQDPNE